MDSPGFETGGSLCGWFVEQLACRYMFLCGMIGWLSEIWAATLRSIQRVRPDFGTRCNRELLGDETGDLLALRSWGRRVCVEILFVRAEPRDLIVSHISRKTVRRLTTCCSLYASVCPCTFYNTPWLEGRAVAAMWYNDAIAFASFLASDYDQGGTVITLLLLRRMA